jgi:3'-phosphoadenosine 5'-phosphosulfate (PAPS) 3'-phosphatase
VRAGGAGYKCLKLINKEVGSLMFIDAKTSKWDTCAGEAIIRAMGGFTATQNSRHIEYLSDESFENSSVLIFSLFEDVLQDVTNIIL